MGLVYKTARILTLYTRFRAPTLLGKFMGGDDETLERRRNQLDKLGFEWRLRVHDDHVASEGNEEEFAVLCEALQVGRARRGQGYGLRREYLLPIRQLVAA